MSTEPEPAHEDTAAAVDAGPETPGATSGPAPGAAGAADEGGAGASDGTVRTASSPAADADPGSLGREVDGEDGESSGEASGESSGETPGGQPEGAGAEGDATPAQVSEAEAELAAQRLERERIARRKAEKQGPIEAGAKLSGTAADLLAAVRAVESGEKPAATVFAEPAPAPRRAAPEPARPPRPVAAERAAGPVGPTPEAVQAVRRVLAEGGAPEALAPQAAALLGEGAEDALRADPWRLLRVGGVRPEQADGFARALLGAACGPDDERRGRAVTVWLLEQAALAGHTALELPLLTAALAQRGVPDPDAAVQSALAEGEALAFQDALEEPGARPASAPGGSGTAAGADGPGGAEAAEEEDEERPVRVLIGLERFALAEESLADGLARLVNSTPKQDGSAADWERAADAARGAAADLVRAVAGHGLVLHTGGEASLAEPAALLRAARALGLRAWAAAPGVLGRDRFSALAGGAPSAPGTPDPGGPPAPEDSDSAGPAPAVTVAGLLAGTEGPGRDADGALDLDLLVVLDAPHLDVEAGALLVESLPDGARLVLAGDPSVLWSVGPGRVFADLLAARICPQVASRLPDPGPLGELVSGIGIGELGQVEAPGKEVVIVPVRDAGEAVHRTVQLVADSVPRAIGVPAEDTQVITPGHGGAVGTRALNAALKQRLNPGPGRFGGFDPGDRVVHSPVPGRVLPGRVVTADADGLHLSCAGEDVVVPPELVERTVRHGWALTAHQAMGGRWPAVVVVLPGDAVRALSRPWIYTAFGRAARHLSVVQGVEQALPRAVAEVPAKPRTTRLPVLLAPQVPTD
ncbi:helix-hairpin-helix domain-containing protein [Streptomyces enissocaesilis]|uniref:Helix-hairpin-helix domain-containing protein n=1 Tax=Streptomyces rochei TaxID=1928 RepID=A0AAX3ZGY1_STRRO|nr:helix-hairpin-helix domain-containing protein [Streptomyces rochei]WDI17551.1 helix-hairpin-helix domain-containing protein [Streptomyces enissocaesilis]WMC85547.1 helix-hairpin-helix domain-containing protein [Streptomyces rochei]